MNVKSVTNFFKDKHGKIVVFQMPNIPLLAWIGLTLVDYFLPKGDFKTWISWLAFGSLVIWAILEIVQGSSHFRRLLGLVVLIFTLYFKFIN